MPVLNRRALSLLRKPLPRYRNKRMNKRRNFLRNKKLKILESTYDCVNYNKLNVLIKETSLPDLNKNLGESLDYGSSDEGDDEEDTRIPPNQEAMTGIMNTGGLLARRTPTRETPKGTPASRPPRRLHCPPPQGDPRSAPPRTRRPPRLRKGSRRRNAATPRHGRRGRRKSPHLSEPPRTKPLGRGLSSHPTLTTLRLGRRPRNRGKLAPSLLVF